MSKPYIRGCKYCGARIRMAKMYNGQWLPFDIHGGKHECSRVYVIDAHTNIHQAVEEIKANEPRQSHRTHYENKPNKHGANREEVSSMFITYFILLVMIYFLISWVV